MHAVYRVGESEKLVRTLFEVAREKPSSIIFFDEIDALLAGGASNSSSSQDSSRRLLTEFLVQFDGVKTESASSVFVMGATNRPEVLDEGVRRRLTKRIYIPLPCVDARVALIESLLSSGGQRHSLGPPEIDGLARILEGYSGSDISAVVKDAALATLREIPFDQIQSTRFP